MGVAAGVGVGLLVGVELAVGVGAGLGVEEGAGIGLALELLTTTETDAVPIGVVPPCWKTRTVRTCVPFATVVEFQVQLPVPVHPLTPSTWSWFQ